MLEKVWYEISPIVYSIVSCVVLFYANFGAAMFASLLLSASLLIGVMRIQSRLTPEVMTKKRKANATTINRRA